MSLDIRDWKTATRGRREGERKTAGLGELSSDSKLPCFSGTAINIPLYKTSFRGGVWAEWRAYRAPAATRTATSSRGRIFITGGRMLGRVATEQTPMHTFMPVQFHNPASRHYGAGRTHHTTPPHITRAGRRGRRYIWLRVKRIA